MYHSGKRKYTWQFALPLQQLVQTEVRTGYRLHHVVCWLKPMAHALPLLILFCFVQKLSALSMLPDKAVCNKELQVGSIHS